VDRSGQIKEAVAIAGARYNFRGKSGVAFWCEDTDLASLPPLAAAHRAGEDPSAFGTPKCDFCFWLPDGGAKGAEAALAEASYACKTMFFLSLAGRAAHESVLRRARYEHALELGRAGAWRVLMCW